VGAAKSVHAQCWLVGQSDRNLVPKLVVSLVTSYGVEHFSEQACWGLHG
jgi:hypothetical protein